MHTVVRNGRDRIETTSMPAALLDAREAEQGGLEGCREAKDHKMREGRQW